MTQNKNQKHIIYLDANNLYHYAISKFLSTGGLKWLDPKEFDLNTPTSNNSKHIVSTFSLLRTAFSSNILF